MLMNARACACVLRLRGGPFFIEHGGSKSLGSSIAPHLLALLRPFFRQNPIAPKIRGEHQAAERADRESADRRVSNTCMMLKLGLMARNR